MDKYLKLKHYALFDLNSVYWIRDPSHPEEGLLYLDLEGKLYHRRLPSKELNDAFFLFERMESVLPAANELTDEIIQALPVINFGMSFGSIS